MAADLAWELNCIHLQWSGVECAGDRLTGPAPGLHLQPDHTITPHHITPHHITSHHSLPGYQGRVDIVQPALDHLDDGELILWWAGWASLVINKHNCYKQTTFSILTPISAVLTQF